MKQPPVEKIPEAMSAIADGRITMSGEKAQITSSSYSKRYTVLFDGDTYASNDSATYWQGYPGYPVIAVLMLQGRLPFRQETAVLFKGINWTALNEKHKRNYEKALSEIYDSIALQGAGIDTIKAEVSEIYNKLAELPLTIKRNNAKPEKL